MSTSETSREVRKRRVSPADIQALQKRAGDWPHIGGITRAGQRERARVAFELYLDFLRAGVLGVDFPRWLSRHSGVSVTTCWRYMKAGEALDVGSRPNRNLTGLVEEQQRERTLGPEVDWADEE